MSEARYQKFIDCVLGDEGGPLSAQQSAHPAFWVFSRRAGAGEAMVELGYWQGMAMFKALLVPPDMRRTGMGALVVSMLCSHADRAGITVQLTVDTFSSGDGTEQPDGETLRRWYGSFGFSGVQSADDWTMRRVPINSEFTDR